MPQEGFGLASPANAQPLFSSRAYASPEQVPHALGTVGYDRYGRQFRFTKAGELLVVGNALQAAAQITAHQNMTPSAAAIDDTSISVTPGATAGAADLYAEGMAIIDTTPGIGYSYPIKTHLAIEASVAFVVKLANGAKIQVALTTSSRVTLVANPFKNVIQMPVTTLTNAIVGVCTFPIASGEYGWIGRNGLFGTLVDGTTAAAVGTKVAGPSGTAGAVTGASGVKQDVGTIMDTLSAGLVQGVDWTL